jgi:hypothetical protein
MSCRWVKGVKPESFSWYPDDPICVRTIRPNFTSIWKIFALLFDWNILGRTNLDIGFVYWHLLACLVGSDPAWTFPIRTDCVTIFLLWQKWYRQMELAYYPGFVLGHLVAARFNIWHTWKDAWWCYIMAYYRNDSSSLLHYRYYDNMDPYWLRCTEKFMVLPRIAGVVTFFNQIWTNKASNFYNFMVIMNTFLGRVVAFFAEMPSSTGRTLKIVSRCQ